MPLLATSIRPARQRVIHIWLFVAAILAVISLQIPGAAQRVGVGSIVMWFLGCALLLAVGGYWVRLRHQTTRRLVELVRQGPLDIERIEHTKILLFGVPFGHEVDIHLRPGERLALGFWTEASCMQLLAALPTEPSA